MTQFTDEELAIAKSVDLTAVASSLGYTVKRIGNYHTLKEMDSIRIYNKSHWFRWSRQYEKGENGGSQIDFLKVFAGMEVKEAVFWLLDFIGYNRAAEYEVPRLEKYQGEQKQSERKPFILPVPAGNNNFLYSYLNNERGISKAVIDFFVSLNLIYESREYHNMVFKGNDKDGITRFASMRGVFDKCGKGFKCDVSGNDKSFGFNVVNEESEVLVIFEAVIDLMSYTDIHMDFESNKLALGMLSDAPLETFLKEHPQISFIRFCLDNDIPGRKATEELTEKYYGLGYDVEDCPPPANYKDYNEWLVAVKIQPIRNEKSLIRCGGEIPWGNESSMGNFQGEKLIHGGISKGKLFLNYDTSSSLYFSMGKIHREMRVLWGISNEKRQLMGNFHGEYKI